MFKRSQLKKVIQRFNEPRRFIQVLAGPRQTGKTTIARQAMQELSLPVHYATADEPALKDRIWIEQQWEAVRILYNKESSPGKALLIIDEIQKITGWSETVKRLWDEDTIEDRVIHVLLLGSSPLLVGKGLTESLTGRFEIIPVIHWTYPEMHEAFGFSLDDYIFHGGYPGAAALINDYERWSQYILNALVETSISRDILLMTRVDKPVLLRRLFELGCSYSGQTLSYQKMLGQLQDAGNTTTLAHYLDLLGSAGLLEGIPKYAGQKVRQRASSPKLIALNTALISVHLHYSRNEARAQPDVWGRLVESAVGAHLANAVRGTDIKLYYWSGRNFEVDFILARGNKLCAIEVKSGGRKTSLPGIEAFTKEFGSVKKILIGSQGIPFVEAFSARVESLL